MWLSKVCLSNASGWPRHSLMQLQVHSVTAHKSHICRLGSDVVVALLYESTLTLLDFCWKARHMHAVQGDVC